MVPVLTTIASGCSWLVLISVHHSSTYGERSLRLGREQLASTGLVLRTPESFRVSQSRDYRLPKGRTPAYAYWSIEGTIQLNRGTHASSAITPRLLQRHRLDNLVDQRVSLPDLQSLYPERLQGA